MIVTPELGVYGQSVGEEADGLGKEESGKGWVWANESEGAPREGEESWRRIRVAMPRPTPELEPVMRMYRRGRGESGEDMLGEEKGDGWPLERAT